MPEDFFKRTDELLETWEGNLEGSVVVDQIYAQYQHEGLDLNHPRGGQAKYLEEPLLAKYRSLFRNVAATVNTDGGIAGMTKSVEQLSDDVKRLAPVDLNNLRRSAAPKVTSRGETVYSRPPEQRRLSQEELNALRRAES